MIIRARAPLRLGLAGGGTSRNVILEAAKSIGMYAVGFTGRSGGAVSNCCDAVVRVPSERTPRIQEMHIGVGHAICQIVEDAYHAGRFVFIIGNAHD